MKIAAFLSLWDCIPESDNMLFRRLSFRAGNGREFSVARSCEEVVPGLFSLSALPFTDSPMFNEASLNCADTRGGICETSCCDNGGFGGGGDGCWLDVKAIIPAADSVWAPFAFAALSPP
jgi:hypothetical protein